jgi:hypothetical protein
MIFPPERTKIGPHLGPPHMGLRAIRGFAPLLSGHGRGVVKIERRINFRVE